MEEIVDYKILGCHGFFFRRYINSANFTEAQFHTVVSGDSLSKIAKHFYGDPMKYPVIFEANKPMLADPDKIYPGQVLRIPAMKG